ncbi:hypothetical protein [uncultured Brevundimonas sp.]|uniref:hypothetical protein n=1 Tax=uncultured Brevundimonas sp. TaxID=213418 RepID=UPI0025E6FA89|nr:hypothetical protein [uncultured Brevundimonas sp.]
MRRLALLFSVLTLAGCATKPPIAMTASAQRNPCTNGILALYFKDEAASLRPSVSMEWPAWAMEECPGAAFKVIGLPEPSAASLQGRRAESIALALRAFGIPQPSFELGEAEDQARPVLEVLARPDH